MAQFMFLIDWSGICVVDELEKDKRESSCNMDFRRLFWKARKGMTVDAFQRYVGVELTMQLKFLLF